MNACACVCTRVLTHTPLGSVSPNYWDFAVVFFIQFKTALMPGNLCFIIALLFDLPAWIETSTNVFFTIKADSQWKQFTDLVQAKHNPHPAVPLFN